MSDDASRLDEMLFHVARLGLSDDRASLVAYVKRCARRLDWMGRDGELLRGLLTPEERRGTPRWLTATATTAAEIEALLIRWWGPYWGALACDDIGSAADSAVYNLLADGLAYWEAKGGQG